jgi:AraC-like DNA-binding protein
LSGGEEVVVHGSSAERSWPSDEHLVFRTADVDEVHDRAQSIMVRHRMEIDTTAGAFCAEVHRAAIGSTEVLAFRYDAPTRIRSAPLDGFITVHVPRHGHLVVEQRGTTARLKAGQAAVISSGSPVDLSWSADLRLLVIKIPEALLRQQVAALTDRFTAESLIFDLPHRLDAQSALAAAIRLALRAIGRGHDVSGGLAASINQALATALLLGHPHNRSAAVWAPEPVRADIVKAVIDAVRADPRGDHTTAGLARLVSVSERTLQLAFGRQVGAPPMTYLRRIRLEIAREQLLASRPEDGVSVLDIAERCGFGHAGRFAAAYRRRFGEPPSATLHR